MFVRLNGEMFGAWPWHIIGGVGGVFGGGVIGGFDSQVFHWKTRGSVVQG